MKNLFKYLSAFALAGMVGLGAMNVSAEECSAGEVEHTNYYLFLDINPASYYAANIPTSGAALLSHYTGADKYNTINKQKVISEGNLAVKSSSKSTFPSETGWTIAQYWQAYYDAYTYRDRTTLSYTPAGQNVSYFMHVEWYKYEDNNFSGGEKRTHGDMDSVEPLMTLLKNNYSNIGATELATKGTSLPDTKISYNANLATLEDPYIRMNVERNFDQTDKLEGVLLGSEKQVYSPAVYYITYCKSDGTGGGETPSTEKTIIYDKNTTEAVDNMPGNQTFKGNCINLDSKRPSRNGFQFLGWSRNATAATAEYSPGQEYCGDSVTLHAIWKKIENNEDGSITIKYDANGGKDAPSDQIIPAGKCDNITTAKPTRENFRFMGWSTNASAVDKDSTYDPGSQYCASSGNITLYAVWGPQTGLSAHFVAFSVVTIAAGAALAVAKKKDLFKQI